MKHLTFFPTPYPDEILYSVLCRYHTRCGIPTARQTNLALWGNTYGKKLFLPDAIEKITERIPNGTNLTAERFINENTIFPLLNPFLTQIKRDELVNSMKFGNQKIYNTISFSRVFTLQHRYLRYCDNCIEDDTQIYGEPYWHRIHQIPGVYICPIHNTSTVESNVALDALCREYYSTVPVPDKSSKSFKSSIAIKLLALAHDTVWLLQHGNMLASYEYTTELYDNWLRAKRYRHHNGKTSSKDLAQSLIDYYGEDFLLMFDAYDSGACTWIKRMIQCKQSFQHPLYHLLLIRFLAGSAEEFFTGSIDVPPEDLPFGTPPYPCRNYVCEYHLKDVILQINVSSVHATPRAMFICTHCGFTYRRKGKTPKEKQYSGQIDIVDYGWRWAEAVTTLLSDGVSPYKIARNFHCDVCTILNFGVEHNLLPPERRMGRKPYIPVDLPQLKMDFNTRLEYYRQRWLALITENPVATRTALRLLDAQYHKWLKKNDANWFELNAPPSKKMIPMWINSDDEHLEMVENAVKQIRDFPGRPKRISIASIGRKVGITKPQIRLTSDKLPKTKAFITANVETLEQWQKRKILWAVQKMRECDEVITVYKVRHFACIEDKKRKLDEFIADIIKC